MEVPPWSKDMSDHNLASMSEEAAMRAALTAPMNIHKALCKASGVAAVEPVLREAFHRLQEDAGVLSPNARSSACRALPCGQLSLPCMLMRFFQPPPNMQCLLGTNAGGGDQV